MQMKLLVPTIMAVCFLLDCGMSLNTEVHLLPAGYQGDVFIVPSAAAGVPPSREGGATVFHIPANGILVTQDHPKSGWHYSQFYYLQPNGERQRLDYEPSSIPDNPKNRSDRRPVVWFERSGTISSVDLPCSVDYVQYYVGSRAHLLTRLPDADELRFRDFLKKSHVCS
jgi:hypothetical protein